MTTINTRSKMTLLSCLMLLMLVSTGCELGEQLAGEVEPEIVAGRPANALAQQRMAAPTLLPAEVAFSEERIAAINAELDALEAQGQMMKLGSDGTISVDFDENEEPCLFIDATPLFKDYQGARFGHRTHGDGGGILDECSNFGVDARSGDNFLAFNSDLEFSIGGVPEVVGQIIKFPGVRVLEVSFYLSGGWTEHTELQIGVVSAAGVVDLQTVTAPDFEWAQITLSGSGIRYIQFAGELDGDYPWLVLDDLEAIIE